MSSEARTADSFATLTHARLRARQGDVRGARAILRELLDCATPDPRAQRLLEELSGRPGGSAADVETGGPVREARRRLTTLQELLRRITHNMGATG